MECLSCKFIHKSFLLLLFLWGSSGLPFVIRSVAFNRETQSKSGSFTQKQKISPSQSDKLPTHSSITDDVTSSVGLDQLIYHRSHKQGSIPPTSSTRLNKPLQYKTPLKHSSKQGKKTYPENFLKVKEVSEDSEGNKVSRMVIIAGTTLAVLFSVGMISAIFLCCCRKKKKSSSDEDETDRKTLIDNNDSPPIKPKTEKDHAEEKEGEEGRNQNGASVSGSMEKKMNQEKTTLETTKDSEDDEDITESVQKRIKAFEVKPEQPSPVPGVDVVRHPKRRPESEAFKNFESKGILIGMGKAPKKRPEPEPHITEEEDQGEKTQVMTPIFVTEITSKKVLDKINKKKPNESTALDETEDDLGDFSVVKRETEILKSHRRAAPPTGRNRISKAMIKGRQSRADDLAMDQTDNGENVTEIVDEKSQTEDIREPNISVTKSSDHDNSKESERTNVKTKMETPGTKMILVEPVSSENDLESTEGNKTVVNTKPVSSDETVSVEKSDNIFFAIDPTAKSKSMGDITRISKSAKDESEVSKTMIPGLKPSGNQEALLSALKRKLQSEVTEDNSTTDLCESSEYLEPIKRERTFSEPTSPGGATSPSSADK